MLLVRPPRRIKHESSVHLSPTRFVRKLYIRALLATGDNDFSRPSVITLALLPTTGSQEVALEIAPYILFLWFRLMINPFIMLHYLSSTIAVG